MAEHQSRKYLLTINNPQEKGLSEAQIVDILATMNTTYYCMANDIAPSTKTPHTHVFIYRKTAIRESTIRRKFPGAHFDSCLGTCAQNREYVAKSGKWAKDPKGDSLVPGSFRECGELPNERKELAPELCDLVEELEAGRSTADIIRRHPKYMFKTNEIDILRETLHAEKYLHTQRNVEVFYFSGATGAGKTRKIFDSHPLKDICRITSYGSGKKVNFDAYHGQSVLVFEEFASQVSLPDMLSYLDRYPLYLPARYSDRIACFDTVYITSNLPLTDQYRYEQVNHPESWRAFLRRIDHVVEFLPDGTQIEHTKPV